ncbi:MAG: hypothetical protein JKY65_20515 [Planctomycetes bacterium]|nr:hypothetical protein [Planctomycetota bacterium]
MTERRLRLEETARILRSRLRHLSTQTPRPHQRPMHDVAVTAVRHSLTEVGRQLSRSDY